MRSPHDRHGLPGNRPGAFVHPALFYRDPEEYTAGVGDFVRTALAADEPVLVAVPGPSLEALRRYLGSDADHIDAVDMTELGRNPGRILAALQGFADRHPGRTARIVGEPIWPGRSRAEVLEATRHEALINTAFAHRSATILCPYDTGALAPEVIADARRTHPTLIESGRELASPAYTDAAVVCADCDVPLTEPAAEAVLVDYAAGGSPTYAGTPNPGPDGRRSTRDGATTWSSPSARRQPTRSPTVAGRDGCACGPHPRATWSPRSATTAASATRSPPLPPRPGLRQRGPRPVDDPPVVRPRRGQGPGHGTHPAPPHDDQPAVMSTTKSDEPAVEFRREHAQRKRQCIGRLTWELAT